MVKVCNRLKNENTDARLVLQIHDELIVEADKSCAEYAAKILKQEMENAARLRVPLEVSVNIGESWYEAKG
jgi:DNA polymerase-1